MRVAIDLVPTGKLVMATATHLAAMKLAGGMEATATGKTVLEIQV